MTWRWIYYKAGVDMPIAHCRFEKPDYIFLPTDDFSKFEKPTLHLEMNPNEVNMDVLFNDCQLPIVSEKVLNDFQKYAQNEFYFAPVTVFANGRKVDDYYFIHTKYEIQATDLERSSFVLGPEGEILFFKNINYKPEELEIHIARNADFPNHILISNDLKNKIDGLLVTNH